jgi:hypothetical protein
MRLDKLLANSTNSEELRSTIEREQAKARQLAQMAEQLTDEIDELSDKIAQLHLESRQERRIASVGLKMDKLVGLNGREYLNVEISSITDAGLVISHSSGIARLVAADLSKEQQFEFGIDSDLSRIAIARESERASAYHRQVDAYTEQNRAKEELALQKVIDEQRSTSSRVATTTASVSTNPLHQPARPFGTTRSYYSARYRYGSRYYSAGSRYGSYYPSYQCPSPAYYSYGSSAPTTRWPLNPGVNRRVNGTPAPSSPVPQPSAITCPSN